MKAANLRTKEMLQQMRRRRKRKRKITRRRKKLQPLNSQSATSLLSRTFL
jgi:hypothetical protein